MSLVHPRYAIQLERKAYVRVITLLGEKGGIGKTTLAVHLAAGLASMGYRTLLIDADPQANATIALGLEPEPALYDLIVRHAAFRNILRVIPSEIFRHADTDEPGTLAVLPSNIETRNIASSTQDSFAIRRRLEEVAPAFDYTVFDTSPTPSLLHGSIFLATDAVIYPTECEKYALVGLQESMTHLQAFSDERQRNIGGLPILSLGIVPTKVRGNTAGHSENLRALREAFPELVWPELPMRIAWSDAALMSRPVWQYDREGLAAKEAWQFVERVVEAFHAIQA